VKKKINLVKGKRKEKKGMRIKTDIKNNVVIKI
jgi:hypothetical protein